MAARRRSLVGGLLLVVGVAMLIAALFLGWYVIADSTIASASGGHFTVYGTETLYPLDEVSIALSCTGSHDCPPSTVSYSALSQSPLSGADGVYALVAVLVVFAIVLGALAAFRAITRRRPFSGRTRLLILVALVLVLLAPALLAVAQPGVLADAESGGSGGSGPSPGSSFVGSCNGAACGQSLYPGTPMSGSWGPGPGWYLSFAAAAPLLAAFLVLGNRRPRVRAAVPTELGAPPAP